MKVLTVPRVHVCKGRPFIFAGDRILTVTVARRTVYDRAIRWAGVNPVRMIRDGLHRAELPDGVDPEGGIVGVCVFVGPRALVVSWPKVTAGRARAMATLVGTAGRRT